MIEHDKMQDGIITKIYLKNFVTYNEVVVKPGKNLNFIIGPNGTGKSTIVSAIVLGLGGRPNVIGRAKHVGDFVLAGKESATIEIELLHGNNFISVRREFNTRSESNWKIDGQNANSKKVIELMKKLNIQVDNLCQFLPQDKVADFSKMSQQDLLIETERSIEPQLLENHLKLKDLRQKQKALQSDLETRNALLAKDNQIHNQLKESVGHINEQKKIKKKLTILKQKRAWVLFQSRKEDFETAKVGKDRAEKKKKTLEKKLSPIKQKIDKLKLSIKNLESAVKNNNNELKSKTTQVEKLIDSIEKADKSVNEIETICEEKIKDEQKRDDKINRIQEQKNKLENDLENLISEIGSIDEIEKKLLESTPELDNYKREAAGLRNKLNTINQSTSEINMRIRVEEKNFEEGKNINDKRLEMLKKYSRDAYEGVLWLRENKHMFSSVIHEPMLMNINIKDPRYSKYFESLLPQRDLIAFVCEDKRDMNLLISKLRDQMNLRINAVHSDPSKDVNMNPKIPLQNIREYGFEHYLISLIEVNPTILKYLVTMYRINEIPIGSEKVQSHLDRLPQVLTRYFSGNNSYSVSYSRYTGEKSIRQSAVYSSGLLSITIDTAKLRGIEDQLKLMYTAKQQNQDSINLLQTQISDVTRKIDAVKGTRNQLQKNLNQLKEVKLKIDRHESDIRLLQRERKPVEEIKKKYKSELQNAIKKQLRIYQNYNKILEDYYKSFLDNEGAKLKVKLLKKAEAVKENESKELQNEFDLADQELRQLINELEPLRVETKRLYQEALKSTGGHKIEDPECAPIKAEFAKLPASAEELFEEIQRTQAKIYCLNSNADSDKTLEDFNKIKKKIQNLTELINQIEAELGTVVKKIEDINNEWLPKVNEFVARINNNFSNYFHKMKCAGEVSLVYGDKMMDFEEYGLSIKVKFRDSDPLQPLTRFHQSGGERAVSTAVYMIALQDLTKVPFRCVDEINQGMDAANERKVFELIVNITSNANSSQYFLLTPKLLPGLTYNESVTVLTIFNGIHMVPSTDYNVYDNINNDIQVLSRRKL